MLTPLFFSFFFGKQLPDLLSEESVSADVELRQGKDYACYASQVLRTAQRQGKEIIPTCIINHAGCLRIFIFIFYFRAEEKCFQNPRYCVPWRWLEGSSSKTKCR